MAQLKIVSLVISIIILISALILALAEVNEIYINLFGPFLLIGIIFDILIIIRKKDNITIKNGINTSVFGGILLILLGLLGESCILMGGEFGCIIFSVPMFIAAFIFLIGLVIKIVGYFLKSDENQ